MECCSSIFVEPNHISRSGINILRKTTLDALIADAILALLQYRVSADRLVTLVNVLALTDDRVCLQNLAHQSDVADTQNEPDEVALCDSEEDEPIEKSASKTPYNPRQLANTPYLLLDSVVSANFVLLYYGSTGINITDLSETINNSRQEPLSTVLSVT